METTNDVQDLVIPEGIRETVSEDGAVLLDIEQGICFSLNPVGLKIWELLKRHCTVEQVADALSRDFSVPREQLIADAREFVAALEAKHLIYRPGLSSGGNSWLRRLTSFGWRKRRSSPH
jgi:coenzyme PQQ synthesis protein D (PqqD)